MTAPWPRPWGDAGNGRLSPALGPRRLAPRFRAGLAADDRGDVPGIPRAICCSVDRILVATSGGSGVAAPPGMLVAFDPGGAPVWRFDLDGFARGPAPIALAGALALVVSEGAVIALDAATGTERWRAPRPAGVLPASRSPSVVADGGRAWVIWPGVDEAEL